MGKKAKEIGKNGKGAAGNRSLSEQSSGKLCQPQHQGREADGACVVVTKSWELGGI